MYVIRVDNFRLTEYVCGTYACTTCKELQLNAFPKDRAHWYARLRQHEARAKGKRHCERTEGKKGMQQEYCTQFQLCALAFQEVSSSEHRMAAGQKQIYMYIH